MVKTQLTLSSLIDQLVPEQASPTFQQVEGAIQDILVEKINVLDDLLYQDWHQLRTGIKRRIIMQQALLSWLPPLLLSLGCLYLSSISSGPGAMVLLAVSLGFVSWFFFQVLYRNRFDQWREQKIPNISRGDLRTFLLKIDAVLSTTS
ncbi:hypothetical protein [Tunicatimonas pelagia]|uniref:hypothetical protein n=1 Tax=Tunicatimonas pelagia TaxID=931531 RepID=UPI00266572EE|nr:hypothetical protein [Tunicatimonas pelagia]WKN46493.1 hypothetical protein P0M28_30550 [Tunicatimonas pelagia]